MDNINFDMLFATAMDSMERGDLDSAIKFLEIILKAVPKNSHDISTQQIAASMLETAKALSADIQQDVRVQNDVGVLKRDFGLKDNKGRKESSFSGKDLSCPSKLDNSESKMTVFSPLQLGIAAILFVCAVIYIFYGFSYNKINAPQTESASVNTLSNINDSLNKFNFVDEDLPLTTELKNYDLKFLKINSPQSYNGMSKKEIYELRKNFVAASLFKQNAYSPNEEVFGGIESGKPWWGINQIVCSPYKSNNFDRISGVSAVSKHVNNPNILVGTVFPYNNFIEYAAPGYCDSEYSKTIPFELSYIPEKNFIIAKYKIDENILKERINWSGESRSYFMNLTGLNARDLGYKYGYISDLKNIVMSESVNMSNTVYEFRDFIHVGYSCKVEGGCNNISPHQTELDYEFNSLPAEMTIKLWKTKPISPKVHADFYYRLVFEKL